MSIRIHPKFAIFGLVLLLTWSLAVQGAAQSEKTVDNEEIKVVNFEELRYPPNARMSHIEGVVVLRVKLDGEGNAVESAAISGPKLLISDCLANAKKWHFQPNSSRSVILVYNFRIEGLCHGNASSQFILHPPNLATVTSCDAVAQP